MITIDYEQLLHRLATVTLSDGTTSPAETIRRLACDSRVIPLVLGGLSEPRDIGRSRTVTAAQRRAVIARDKHGALPGCRQPARRCDVHHIISWPRQVGHRR